MPTINKPQHQVEWIPIIFIFGACYIVTLLAFVRNAGDAVVQGAIGIATTFSGAAAGAYGSKLVQGGFGRNRATDAEPGNPTSPANPAQP